MGVVSASKFAIIGRHEAPVRPLKARINWSGLVFRVPRLVLGLVAHEPTYTRTLGRPRSSYASLYNWFGWHNLGSLCIRLGFFSVDKKRVYPST